MLTKDNAKTWNSGLIRYLLPNPGTLVIVLLLLWAQNTGAAPWLTPTAAPSSASTINYQGRLFNSSGQPVKGQVNLTFGLYNQASGGSPVWGSETHSNVTVSDGLFSVLLGSQLPIPLSAIGGDLWLETKVNGETLSPREQLGAVAYAMQALTVPDRSITTAKLNVDDTLDLQAHSLSNVVDITGSNPNLIISNGGNLRLRSDSSVLVFFDANNDSDASYFRILNNNGSLNPPVQVLLSLDEIGNLSVMGSVSHGALIENNLQTPDELAAGYIDRFSEGDVLCWGSNRLELCNQSNNLLVQAVADKKGKPIIVGAEIVKVVGSVQRGDLLVASDIAGYAIVNNNPSPGAVIAQALEDFAGQRGLIKAMIHKF